jgi:tRNA(adenine34) deaminase
MIIEYPSAMTTAASSFVEASAAAPAPTERETGFMRLALAAAEEAAGRGEVPVGAVVVLRDVVVAVAHNERETGSDPTAHAEIVALRRAAAALGSWRLTDADLYVTMEPCPMCAGALVNARVRRLYFGCDDPKAGAVRTLYTLLDDKRLNHRVEVVPGVLAAEGSALLRGFFSRLRRP